MKCLFFAAWPLLAATAWGQAACDCTIVLCEGLEGTLTVINANDTTRIEETTDFLFSDDHTRYEYTGIDDSSDYVLVVCGGNLELSVIGLTDGLTFETMHDCKALPLFLLNFQVKAIAGGAQLDYELGGEGITKVEVQRFRNNWKTIHRHTTDRAGLYSFLDRTAKYNSAHVYYRLMIDDTPSQIVSYALQHGNPMPNILKASTDYTINLPHPAYVYAQDGRFLRALEEGRQVVTFPSKGIYFMTGKNGVRKIVVQ